jgi:hypothetical protein
MSQQTKEQRLAAVHARAIERFDRCYASQREIRLQCAQDRRFVFVPGAQFEGDLADQFENRPRFEISKVANAVIRIFSEYRNNRVTVDFRPADGDTSDETAEFLDDLYRGDEQENDAQEAYDTAFEEGVAGGMGAWRLVNRYEDDEDEDDDRRRICIEPIPDADNSVFFDIDAKRYDKRDATYCFVITSMAPPEYGDRFDEDADAAIKEWGDRRKQAKNITSFDRTMRMGIYDWFQPEVVYTAEYFEIEEVSDPVQVWKSGATDAEEKLYPKRMEKDAYDAEVFKLRAQGFFMSREKKRKRRVVHKYVIDGSRVLDDAGVIAGKFIPVIPFYAKRAYVDNIERINGHIRFAIDAQRLYNMLMSLLAEISVQTPVEKPIFTPEQVAGHQDMWALDGVKRYPYLLVNPITDPTGAQVAAGPLGYTKPPALPPALAALIELIGIDLREILNASGDQQEMVSNISAKAVELIQNRLDMQSFIYMDNFKKSMRRCGEIWLSMARDLYDEDDRPMRVVRIDGSDEIAMLRQPSTDKDGKVKYLNDPAGGKFKAVADVGPSYTTRRDGTVRAITGMLQFVHDPADQAVLTATAVKNLEGEGLEPVKKHFRQKLLALGLEKPTEEEQAEIDQAQANQKPDPQATFLLAEAEKAMANAEKARADAEKARAQTVEALARVEEIASKLDTAELDRILKMVEATRKEEEPAPAAATEPAALPA